MALLSNKKVSVFNESLIKFMEKLVRDHWNKKGDVFEEVKSNPESDGKSSNKAAFIID
jgi:hypothetical protein